MPRDIVVLFDQEDGRRLIENHCRKIGLPVGDLQRLIEEVIDKSTMQRRHGLWQAFDEVLDADVGAHD
ncbi:DNA modification system-associated small protein [Immundisolibacter sp.]|uniref:DNA modification system-associated small protein n=1 Tax=Immundisolibacter sp. TaxID=1934948 RepID=UPI00341CFA24